MNLLVLSGSLVLVILSVVAGPADSYELGAGLALAAFFGVAVA